MMPPPLTDDAKAVLLLCSELGSGTQAVAPLVTREYDDLARWLYARQWRPAKLLDPTAAQAMREGISPVDPIRVEKLLSRGLALALCVEKWTNKGMWVFCRSDAEGYPKRLKEYLRRAAPPVIYGVGNWHRLDNDGLVLWNASAQSATANILADIGRRCAEEDIQIVLPGMRGEGRRVLKDVFASRVSAVCVLSDRLFDTSLTSPYREAVMSGSLTLVSTASPDVALTGPEWHARERSTADLVDGLADQVLILAGAERAAAAGLLAYAQRQGSRPMFLLGGGFTPKEERKLQDAGAKVIEADSLRGGLRKAMQQATVAATVRTIPEVVEPARNEPGTSASPTTTMVKEASTVAVPSAHVPDTVLEAVKPLVILALDRPSTITELANVLKIRKPQMQDWVKALLAEGVLEERVKGKTKKVAVRRPDQELGLV